MKAVQWFDRGDVRVVDVPEPREPSAGELLVDVEWCGICGTDVEEFLYGPIAISTKPHPLTGSCAPLTVGHEVSGRVAAAGAGVALAPGTPVALDGYVACGSCQGCKSGHPNRCERWAFIGMSMPGGLAERILVPADMVISGPAGTPTDELALAEPFAVAVRAVRRSGMQLGDHVAVIGGGTIGLAVAQVASAAGAGRVDVIESLGVRRHRAEAMGFAVASSTTELGSAEGAAFDIVLDATGSSETPAETIGLARPGGRVVIIGLPVEPCTMDLQSLVLREVTVVGTVGHVVDRDTRAAVALIASGRVDARSLISHRIPLDRAVDDGIAFLAGPGRLDALKVLVTPRPALIQGRRMNDPAR